MENLKIMSAEQAFNYAMNCYPSLYTDDNVADARYKYFDHIFNTIGNGYRTLSEFIEEHTITKENEEFIKSFPEKYITSEPLYYAYTQVRKFGDFDMPEQDSVLSGLYTEKELELMPEVIYKVCANSSLHPDEEEEFVFKESLVPYPNFSKEYSMVWRMDMSKLDASWRSAAKEYYLRAKNFFESDVVHFYHNAAPKVDYRMEEAIESYEKNFNRYKKEGMTNEEWYKVISKEYEQEYNGDTKLFIEERWKVEHSRILSFIYETLNMLGYEMTTQPKNKPKI